MDLYGRQVVYTTEQYIDENNIINVVRQGMIDYLATVGQCNFLLNYEAGMQPLQRVKTVRADIDIIDIDNIANEITDFKKGFIWGFPITLAQRGIKDTGVESESQAVTMLNEAYSYTGINAKRQQLARFVEITGIGYTFVDIDTSNKEDKYFSVDVLDPRCAFVIRSKRTVDKRVVVGVSFFADSNGTTYYTAFTPERRYEIVNWKVVNGNEVDDKWAFGSRSGEINPLGAVPIVEWVRDYDRMGCFERQINEMDTLNIMWSDFANDVDQNTQVMWHANDVDIPTDEEGNEQKPESNDWVFTYTADGGKSPFINPLSVNYDYQGILQNIVSKRALILQKCNVPQRNDNSGGSTGIAMSDATGWSAADNAANTQAAIMQVCKMEEVELVLKAINRNPKVPQDSPLLRLRSVDIEANIKRQRNYELTVKSNALATLLSHGVYGLHAFKTVNIFDDNNQVWEDSKELINAYQEKLIKGNENIENTVVEKVAADNSDQIDNSPVLDKG